MSLAYPLAAAAIFAVLSLIWRNTLGPLNDLFYIAIISGLVYWGTKFSTNTLRNKQSQILDLTLRIEELEKHKTELLASKQSTSRQNEYLALLHETTLGLVNRLELDDLLTAIVKRAGELLATPHGYVYLVENNAEFIEIKVGVGLYSTKIGQQRTSCQGLCGKVWWTGQPLAVEDYQRWVGRLPDRTLNDVHSAIGVPLKSGTQVIGVLGLDYVDQGRSFGEDEINILCRFAELASIALDNAHLYAAAQNEIMQQKLSKQKLAEAEIKIRKQNEYLACLHETALALMNRLELTDLLETIIIRLNIIAGTSNSFVTLNDEQRGVTITKVGTGIYSNRVGLEMKIGQGVSGKVWETGQQVLINNYGSWQDRLSDANFSDIQSIIGIPLNSGAGIIGVIGLTYPDNNKSFTNEDTNFFSGFAKLASIAIDNARLYDSAQYLSLHDSLTGLYNRVFFEEEARRTSTERFYPLGIINCDIDGLKLANDTIGHAYGDILLKQAAQIIKKCFRQSDIVARIGGDEFAVLLPNTTNAIIETACARLRESIGKYNQNNTGFPLSLSIGYSFSEDSTQSIHQLLKEADDYMYREKLHSSQSTRNSIVQTLKKALEARDFITEGHADRIQSLMANLGEAIGLNEHQISDLRLLAQFHDIGKVGIPDSILFKKGPLTAEEFNEMRRHSEIGYRIAKSAPDLAPIAHCILKHHEWWNGQGYPLGLKNNEIPLECRILSIADAFDAMTSDRPYRQALPVEDALQELKRCGGIQFDPYLVEKFIKYIKCSNYFANI